MVFVRSLFVSLAVVALAGCIVAGNRTIPNETLTRYGGAGVWRLVESNGQEVSIDLRVGFPHGNIIWMEGPCNSFSGLVGAPYPWFSVTDLKQTGRRCALLDAERAYMAQIDSMTQSEVSGNVLLLSNELGQQMSFDRIR